MSFTSIETAQRMAAVEKKRKEGGDVMGTLTMRDYFAAKAMQGLMNSWAGHTGTEIELIDIWAVSSYAVADAMLQARDAK